MAEPHKILLCTAINIISKKHIPESKYKEIVAANIMETHINSEDGYVKQKLVFKDGTKQILNIGIEEFNDIPFKELFDDLMKSEEYDYLTTWFTRKLYDIRPSMLLLKSALAMVVKNHLPEKKLNDLVRTDIMSVYSSPDNTWIRVELTFKNGGTNTLDIGIEELDNIPFTDLFNAVLEK